MEHSPDTIYVAEISHGKDSIAMLHVICDILHYPLNMIATTDVWFDETIRAELPSMVEWKDKADEIIFEKWGIPVTHLCAMRGGREIPTHDILAERKKKESLSAVSKDSHCGKAVGAKNLKLEKLTYKDIFYRKYKKKDSIYGFPERGGQWCTSELKQSTASLLSKADIVQENSKKQSFQFRPLERRAK